MQVIAMTSEDLPAVLAIESQGHPRPWPESIFREELKRDWASLVVLKSQKGIVAFANFWIVTDEVQILNIVTAQEARRQGFGTVLLLHILETAKQQNCRTVSLEVREGNVGAIALYESHGFCRVGVRPQYYADNKEDALVMVLECSEL